MYSPLIQKLIDIFAKFPTVGPRTAARFVFYLIKMPQQEFEALISSLKNVRESIKTCSFCFNPFDASQSDNNLCPICQDLKRDQSLLCVLEKETDLNSIEKTKRYKGLYLVLGQLASAKKINENNLRIEELKERIKNPAAFGVKSTGFGEVIIALNPTAEGEVAGLFVERKIKELDLPKLPKITRLGRGLPIGGELEYADEETLNNAFEGRK